MSNTYCRYCDIAVQGLYLNCPRCGEYLAPLEPNERRSKAPPEPFQIVEYGKSWQTAPPPQQEQSDGEH